MKKIVLLLFLSLRCLAQVGIDTTNPSGTLDLPGSPSNASVLDGLVLPNVTGNTLTGTTYTSSQKGDFLFVTAKPTSPNSQTKRIQSIGPAFFDGSAWWGPQPNLGGILVDFGDIGCCGATITVNGDLVSAVRADYLTWFSDVLITHNLNLSNYQVNVTLESISTGNNYAQLNLDSAMFYIPIVHDVGANSFSVLLEDYPAYTQTLRLHIDIVPAN